MYYYLSSTKTKEKKIFNSILISKKIFLMLKKIETAI